MKNFIVRFVLAAAAVLIAFALAAPARSQDVAGSAVAQSSRGQGPKASFRDAQTQEALAFAGRLVKEKGRILLKDAVTKMSYELDNQSRARPYIGRQVRVVGKLDLDSNMIHIDRIEPLS